MSIELLNDNQKAIYQYVHVEQHTLPEAARHFNSTIGLIGAQITRCRTKGCVVNVKGEDAIFGANPALRNSRNTNAKSHHSSGRPTGTVSSNENIIEKASKAGDAQYEASPVRHKNIDVDKAIETAKSQVDPHDMVKEVHPMIMMGCAIQFMRLCGGRLHAHQIIEDVYEAVRLHVGAQEVPGVTTETKAFGVEEGSPLDKMEAVLADMRKDPQFSKGSGQPQGIGGSSGLGQSGGYVSSEEQAFDDEDDDLY